MPNCEHPYVIPGTPINATEGREQVVYEPYTCFDCGATWSNRVVVGYTSYSQTPLHDASDREYDRDKNKPYQG